MSLGVGCIVASGFDEAIQFFAAERSVVASSGIVRRAFGSKKSKSSRSRFTHRVIGPPEQCLVTMLLAPAHR